MPVSGGGPYIKYGFEVGEGMLVSGGGPYKLWLAWGCLLKKLKHTLRLQQCGIYGVKRGSLIAHTQANVANP